LARTPSTLFESRWSNWLDSLPRRSRPDSADWNPTPKVGERRSASPRPFHTIPWCCTAADSPTAVEVKEHGRRLPLTVFEVPETGPGRLGALNRELVLFSPAAQRETQCPTRE
jgi:hypothetical protein